MSAAAVVVDGTTWSADDLPTVCKWNAMARTLLKAMPDDEVSAVILRKTSAVIDAFDALQAEARAEFLADHARRERMQAGLDLMDRSIVWVDGDDE